MWCAVGQTLEELTRLPDAVRAYERANECDDREGVALAKLAALYERMARESPAQQVEYIGMAAHYHALNLARRDDEGMGGAETSSALRFLATHAVKEARWTDAEGLCVRLLEYPGMSQDVAKQLMRDIHSRRGKNS
jgi:anaphase-promoting complex subunit 8